MKPKLSKESAEVARRLGCVCVVCHERFVYHFRRKTCSPKCEHALRSQRAEEKARTEPVKIRTFICGVCSEPFDLRAREKKRKTCSPACARAAATTRNRRRTGRANPNYRHGRNVGHDRDLERAWRSDAARVCQRCRSTHRLAQHHIVYEQHVRREGGDIYDPRNGLTLCAQCHSSHHKRGRVLTLAYVPDAALEFATDLFGAEKAYNYLRRRYAGEDPRLDALLASYGVRGL